MIRRVLVYYRPYWYLLLSDLIAVALISALNITVPYLLKIMVDSLIPAGNLKAIFHAPEDIFLPRDHAPRFLRRALYNELEVGPDLPDQRRHCRYQRQGRSILILDEATSSLDTHNAPKGQSSIRIRF